MWRERHHGLAPLAHGLRAAALGALLARASLAGELPSATAADLKSAFQASGRPRLVHVWATWCAPCVAEWPRLAEALRGWHRRDVDVVTLALDDAARAGKAAALLRDAGGVPGSNLLASPAEAIPAIRSFDPEWDGAVPSTWLLGPDGTVLLAQRGGTRLKRLGEEIDRLEKLRAEGANVAKERRR